MAKKVHFTLFLQFFGTIYKGQLDCVHVILFTKLLQLMGTFYVLKSRIPFSCMMLIGCDLVSEEKMCFLYSLYIIVNIILIKVLKTLIFSLY